MVAEPASRGRRWWAPIGAGALLCLACCAAPLLIAAGLLGTGPILVTASWLEPLGLLLLAAGIGGLIRTRRRRACGCRSAGVIPGSGDGGEAGNRCACPPATLTIRWPRRGTV